MFIHKDNNIEMYIWLSVVNTYLFGMTFKVLGRYYSYGK